MSGLQTPSTEIKREMNKSNESLSHHVKMSGLNSLFVFDYMIMCSLRNKEFRVIIIIIIIITIITSFKSYLAEHSCLTNWGDYKSNWITTNQIKFLVFVERGKPKYPGKNLWEQSREPTNSTNTRMASRTESNPGHIGGERVLSSLRQPCKENTNFFDWLQQRVTSLAT